MSPYTDPQGKLRSCASLLGGGFPPNDSAAAELHAHAESCNCIIPDFCLELRIRTAKLRGELGESERPSWVFVRGNARFAVAAASGNEELLKAARSAQLEAYKQVRGARDGGGSGSPPDAFVGWLLLTGDHEVRVVKLTDRPSDPEIIEELTSWGKENDVRIPSF